MIEIGAQIKVKSFGKLSDWHTFCENIQVSMNYKIHS